MFTFFGKKPWVEGKTIDQARDIEALETTRALALMPDAHPGRNGPVGMVLDATRVYPLLIGNDIGCGMAVARLSKPARKLKVDKAVKGWSDLDMPFDEEEAWKERHGLAFAEQLGTIGLGNHFCELTYARDVQEGSGLEKGDALIFVHTGSRGHGTRVVNALPSARDGLSEEEARVYLREHDACLDFARVSREAVVARAALALGCEYQMVTDVPHNLVERVGDVWRHRKGAASAKGLVPVAGTRETPSWLVVPSHKEGALESLPHGSGRKIDRSACHGRFKAPRREKDGSVRFDTGRVICGNRGLLVEEMAGAYKDTHKIAQAIEDEGLGRVVARLDPQLTFKVGV